MQSKKLVQSYVIRVYIRLPTHWYSPKCVYAKYPHTTHTPIIRCIQLQHCIFEGRSKQSPGQAEDAGGLAGAWGALTHQRRQEKINYPLAGERILV